MLTNACEIVSHPNALFSTLKQHSKISNLFPVQMQLAMVLCCTAMIIMKGRTCATVAIATIWILEQTPNNDYCERFLSSLLLRKKYLSLRYQHSVRLVKLQLCNLVYVPDVNYMPLQLLLDRCCFKWLLFFFVLLLSSASQGMTAKPEGYIKPVNGWAFCQSRYIFFLVLSISSFFQHCHIGSKKSWMHAGCIQPPTRRPELWSELVQKDSKIKAHSLITIKLIWSPRCTHVYDPWCTHSPMTLKIFLL